MRSITLAASAAVLFLAALVPAYADPGNKQLTLVDGTVHDNPGAMFQYLRTRDNGLAAGNPKAIVNAYPDSFKNVGDLIHQKRDATNAAAQ